MAVDRTLGNITFWPIFHSRMEFAAEVRLGLLADPPDVVAVELPGTWREPILRAVNRLPFLSLVLSEEGDAAESFLPVEPHDPIIEALRTARELGIPVELIDLDVDRYPRVPEAIPDPYAVRSLGYETFLENYYEHGTRAVVAGDDLRETMMAHALQRLSAEGGDRTAGEGSPKTPPRIACVLGAAHLPGVLERMSAPQPRPFARVKARRLSLYNWSLRSSMEFLSESPFLAAAYEHWRTDPLAQSPEGAPEREPEPGPDREAESETMLRAAAAEYHTHVQEEISPFRLRRLGTFARKYALVDGMVVPDLFQLVTAARGVVDDDYAFEVWDKGSHYPWQDGSGMLPTIDLDETFAHTDGRRLTLRRKLRRNRPRLGRFARKKRLKELYGGRWKSQWSGRMICSHPPEDLVVEDYGRYLKHKAQAMMAAERTRVEPFQVSLKDGVDIRETLRNWHEGKLYVREVLAAGGRVGSVVVIFDRDQEDGGGVHGILEEPALDADRFPWCVTWLGENNQESDMAFYATPAGEQVVGPGISRCQYGGFVMSYPPQRMFDVWNDPYYEVARDKPERLLLAGLDYAQESCVLYVAEKPPRTWFHGLASRMGKKLIYLPLGQLQPGMARKIRTFHVLDGHHVREYADEYIG